MAHLDLDITDGVATLTMNRPEARNALSMEMRAQLIEVLHDIEHNNTV
ncbi:MAG: enoyl-CoA hydratase-related protein, partial [OM182 bacterium]